MRRLQGPKNNWGMCLVLDEKVKMEDKNVWVVKRKIATVKRTAPNWHLYYHYPCWKTAYLHWRPSCQCQPVNAGWTSWFGGDVSVATCTSPCPSIPLSADCSLFDCQWSTLEVRTKREKEREMERKSRLVITFFYFIFFVIGNSKNSGI